MNQKASVTATALARLADLSDEFANEFAAPNHV
jgi:hypothetical protein